MKKILAVLLAGIMTISVTSFFSGCSQNQPEESKVVSESSDDERIADMDIVNKLVNVCNIGKPSNSLTSLPKGNKNLSELVEKTDIKQVIAYDLGIVGNFPASLDISVEDNTKLVISHKLNNTVNGKTKIVAETYLHVAVNREHDKLNTCLYAQAVSELIENNPDITIIRRWYNGDGELFEEDEFNSADVERLIEEQSFTLFEPEESENNNTEESIYVPESSLEITGEYSIENVLSDSRFSEKTVSVLTMGYPFVLGTASENENKIILRMYLQKEPEGGYSSDGDGYITAFFNDGDAKGFAQIFANTVYNEMGYSGKGILIVERFYSTTGELLGEKEFSETDF